MKRILYFLFLVFTIFSCKDDDINVFEKSAAERTAEAIENLKSELTAPANGWRVKYQPEDEAGSYNVLLKFNEDNTVYVRTDLSVNNGEFFEDTLTYRIDNTTFLELTLESYSFFGYLFERDQATFGAEYQFIYQSKTGSDLVFVSKSDPVDPTITIFEIASPASDEILGQSVATKLATIQDGVGNFTTTFKIDFETKDLSLQVSMDELKRVLNINAAMKPSTGQVQLLQFTTGYIVQRDSIVLHEAFSQNVFGEGISIAAIQVGELADSEISLCGTPKNIKILNGITSSNHQVTIASTLDDFKGTRFATVSNFFVSPPSNIINNGDFAGNEVAADLPGVLAMQLYYNYDGFYAMGFVLEKVDGTVYFALQDFIPTLNGNQVQFEFTGDIIIYGTTEPEVDLANVKKYIDLLTEGGPAYVFEYAEDVYEFYNPCSGWSFVFLNVNS